MRSTPGVPEPPARPYAVGDHITVLRDNPAGNPRTPHHARGRMGVVIAVHGMVDSPLDDAELSLPMYTARFDVLDDRGSPTGDGVCVEVHDDWLDRRAT